MKAQRKMGRVTFWISVFVFFCVFAARGFAIPAAAGEVSGSTMVAPVLYSPTLKLDWNYTAYLPAGYSLSENADKKYPVIYLLHGAYGNHRNLVERFPIQKILDELIATGQLPECIVIFPDGFNSYYVNGPAFAMEDAFVKDLFPTIEKLYRVDARKEKRIIGGISMGGYGAARFALKYPELFNCALLISPAIWEKPQPGTGVTTWHVFPEGDAGFSQKIWEQFSPQGLFESYKAAGNPVEFYIISGAADTTVPIETVRTFADKLSAVATVELSVEENGIHAWTFWEGATKKALQFAGQRLR